MGGVQSLLEMVRVFKEVRETFKDGFGTDQKVIQRLEAVEKKLNDLRPSDVLPADYNKFKENVESQMKGISAQLKKMEADIKQLQGK